MKNIINKAIKVGYKPKGLEDRFDRLMVVKNQYEYNAEWIDDETKIRQVFSIYQIICDPLFWQALGKACNWEDFTEGYDMDGDYAQMETWKDIALQFHGINLTQGFDKAVEWLEEQVN